jgi:hypothetical protein
VFARFTNVELSENATTTPTTAAPPPHHRALRALFRLSEMTLVKIAPRSRP